MQYSRYFQTELSALRDLGREFSEQNPRLAPFLSVEGQDPDVERLLEGFAFLTGRIRQKLDDDLPEFAWSLIKLIWPHFLQSIPSITTVELNPLDILSGSQPLPQGAEVKSIPVDGTACIFKTAFDVDVQPMCVKSVAVTESGGRSTMALTLRFFQSAQLTDITLDTLNIHLHGGFPKASLWYYLLRQRLVSVDIYGGNEEQRYKLGTLPASAVKPSGLTSQKSLFESSGQQFAGHRLLFEYFCYPEKYLYLDIHGAGELLRRAGRDDSKDIQFVTFEFRLDHLLPSSDHPTADNIRLFCTPAVNQFQASARPFLLDHRRAEHKLRVEAPTPDHYEIMSVDHIEGWSPETRTVNHYTSIESFCPSQISGASLSDGYNTYWSQQRPAINGNGQDTYVSFVSMLQKPLKQQQKITLSKNNAVLKAETISGQVTCSNRHLPSKLKVGDICNEASSMPEYLNCTNISSVTPSYSPATKLSWIWRLISHSALNLNNLHDVDSLKALLSQFDLRGLFDKQQHAATQLKVEGLLDLSVNLSTRLFKGVPVKGHDVELTVKCQNFTGLGDIFLLGEVLNEFFAVSTAINSFHRLTIKTVPDSDVLQWEARVGDCHLN